MKGFIVDIDTKVEEKTQLRIFGRLENAQSFVALIDFKSYFFIGSSSLEKAKKYCLISNSLKPQVEVLASVVSI